MTVSQYMLLGTALRADHRPYAFDVVAVNLLDLILHYTSYMFGVHSSVIAEFAAAA